MTAFFARIPKEEKRKIEKRKVRTILYLKYYFTKKI